MKISFAITVCNEFEEIKRLVPFLLENKRVEDEIVILYDDKNGNSEILEYLLPFNVKPNVQKWKWRVDSENRINYPDYQGRLYRKNLMWEGKVHERIVGTKFYSILPDDNDYCIIHHKDIKKQEKQNNYYNTL